MSRLKQFAPVLGILIAVGAGGFAWYAARTTNDLRARAQVVRGEIAAAEKQARTVKAAGADEEAASTKLEAPAVPPSAVRPLATESVSRSDDPQIQALRLKTFRNQAALDYFSFGRAAGLNENQYARFLDLMVEHEAGRLDLLAAAKTMGLSTRDTAYAALQKQEQNRHQVALNDLLGPTGARQLEDYHASAPVRKAVGELAGELALTSAPLQPEQSRQLVALLDELGFRDRDRDPAWWGKVTARASTILGPGQAAELQSWSQLQQGTDASLQLSRLVNQRKK